MIEVATQTSNHCECRGSSVPGCASLAGQETEDETEQVPKAPNLSQRHMRYNKKRLKITLALHNVHMASKNKQPLVQASVVLFPVRHVLSLHSGNLLGWKWPSWMGCKNRSDFAKSTEATSQPPSGPGVALGDVHVVFFNPVCTQTWLNKHKDCD